MYGTKPPLAIFRHLGGPHDPALFHRGGVGHTIEVHRRHVSAWYAGKAPDPGPRLFGRLASDRIMRVAYDGLYRHGGHAPGPDGLTFREIEEYGQAWNLCRGLAHEVRDRTYAPGPLRMKALSKGPGRDDRLISIPNLRDRVVGRSLVEVVQPIFDPVFQPFSFGWRPGLDRLQALATLLSYAERTGHWHWVVDDVKDAFNAIPHARMLASCQRLLPDDVVEFIGLLAAAGRRRPRGIAQGGPASPLLANIHFDAHLDGAWYRQQPGVPLIRTADDLLVCAPSRCVAEAYHDRLRSIASSTSGTPLKGGDNAGVRDVMAGEPVYWLGFHIQRVGDRIVINIGPRAWWNLEDQLRACRSQDELDMYATATVLGWIDQAGPAYHAQPRADFIDRLRGICEQGGLALSLSDAEIMCRLRTAYARYQKLIKWQGRYLYHKRWLIEDWTSRRDWPCGAAGTAR